jgi:hypothetical protein
MTMRLGQKGQLIHKMKLLVNQEYTQEDGEEG